MMVKHLLFYLFAFNFLALQLARKSTISLGSKSRKQLGALDHLLAKGLQQGQGIERDESVINLSVILTNMTPDEAKVPKSMFSHLDKYLSSLLHHLTQESRLRLLVISDATLVHLLGLHLKM